MLVNCPDCRETGAYKGLRWVHCQNVKCRYYDARYTEKVRQEADKGSLRGYGIRSAVDKLILLRGEAVD